MVKDSLKNCSRNGEASLRNRHCFHLVNLGTGRFAYSGARIQSRFYPGDCVTRTGDREIRSVSGRVGMNEFYFISALRQVKVVY